MIVLCVTNCPPGLRGDLSKWLCEVNTGVYVGKLNAKVREELWGRVCSNIKSGQATMVYSTNNEQGCVFLTHNTTWSPVDYEGITLMKKPRVLDYDRLENHFLQPGFSRAAVHDKISHSKHSDKTSGYVVMAIITTGSHIIEDRIVDIGLILIVEGEVKSQMQCLVRINKPIPSCITEQSGITNEMVAECGVEEGEVVGQMEDFIGDKPVVGYDLHNSLRFLQGMCKRAKKSIAVKRTKDVLSIAQRKLDDLDDDSLELVAAYFDLKNNFPCRALDECKVVHQIYVKLNEI